MSAVCTYLKAMVDHCMILWSSSTHN